VSRIAGHFEIALRQSLAARHDLIVRVVHVATISALFFAVWHVEPGSSFAGREVLVAYWIVAQLLFALTAPGGLGHFAGDVRSGRIFLIETRPGSHAVRLASGELGARLPVIALLLALGAGLAAGGAMPAIGPGGLVLLAACAALSFLIAFQIEFAFSALAFRVPHPLNLAELRQGLPLLLGGVLVPVDRLPAPLDAIARATPYPWIVGRPAETVAAGGTGAMTVLATQAAWALALVPVSVAVERSVRRRAETFDG